MAESADPTAPIVPVYEAEHMIMQLKPFPLEEVGTEKWMEQHEVLENLNMQAHQNARSNTDEYILEYLITYDKFPTLIHELLVIETYKEKVWPLVKEHAASLQSSMKPYLILYHEATLVNLFEVLLYHRSAGVACGEAVLELVDYCHRKLTYLASRDPDELWPMAEAKRLLEASPLEVLETQRVQIEFNIALCCLSIVRYLAEYAGDLALGTPGRLVEHQDLVSVLVELLDVAPWRRMHRDRLCYFSQGQWVPLTDPLQLYPPLPQVWLALLFLVCGPACAQRTAESAHRRQVLQRLSRHWNDVLFDQLPPLVELRRAVDMLAVGQAPAQRSLLLEPVPPMREALRSGRDWEQLAADQRRRVLRPDDAGAQAQLQRLAKLYGHGAVETLIGVRCAQCGAEARSRCSKCKSEWYCGRPCQVQHWKTHKTLCEYVVKTMSAAAAGAAGAASAADSRT